MKKQPKINPQTLGAAKATWDKFVKASTITSIIAIAILSLMALFLV